MWGVTGVQKEAAFAAKRVIVVVEEIVKPAIIRADPNRTVIPGFIVSAVVKEPFGAHPSYVQGHYDRDNDFYVRWEEISRDPTRLDAYLAEYVHGVPDRKSYARKLKLARLKAKRRLAAPVNYGY
jgi:glutaconate CoA-transferase, subunit A